MKPELSIVIPAFNEANRLPAFLRDIRSYFSAKEDESYEVIVVNDGSGDETGQILEDFADCWDELKFATHRFNSGKGAAVQTGVALAQGELILYCDADGATPIAEEARLRLFLEDGADIVVGSRLLSSSDFVVNRDLMRTSVGWLFSFLARCLLPLRIRDTQCGFKMLRRDVAQELFSKLVEKRYCFDVDILVRATVNGCKLVEAPIRWEEMPGSKVNILRDGLEMLRSLVRIRLVMRHLKNG